MMGQNMIKKLRRRFIAMSSTVIFVILIFVISCINGMNAISNFLEVNDILEYLSEFAGRMPSFHDEFTDDGYRFRVTAETPYETRYFSVITDADGNVIWHDYDHIAAVNGQQAEAMTLEVLSHNDRRGAVRIAQSHYEFYSRVLSPADKERLGKLYTDGGYVTVFLDCTRRAYSQGMTVRFSVMIGLISFLLFFLLISLFSEKAIQPTIAAYEKQKEFVTNAGHELKTPLAVISANTEVIEMTTGQNEWTQSTLMQVKRLSTLVSRLITISKLDESDPDQIDITQDIDLSAVLNELTATFGSLAIQSGNSLTSDIAENVKIKGDTNSVRELFSILIDNAVKYCDAGGEVKVTLTAKKKAVCTVSNTYKDGGGTDYSRFFDRFYRGDQSHNNEKSGFGIGLSMAQSIVKIHKGKIDVSWNDGMISFTVTI